MQKDIFLDNLKLCFPINKNQKNFKIFIPCYFLIIQKDKIMFLLCSTDIYLLNKNVAKRPDTELIVFLL